LLGFSAEVILPVLLLKPPKVKSRADKKPGPRCRTLKANFLATLLLFANKQTDPGERNEHFRKQPGVKKKMQILTSAKK